MKDLSHILTITLFVGATAFAQNPDGPFGFRPGMTKAEVLKVVGEKAVDKTEGDVVYLTTAPNPHKAFDSYGLTFSPQAGLLRVVALGNTLECNDFGTALRNEFDALSSAVGKAYGPPHDTFDYLRDGSIWAEPRDWMVSLLKKDRHLAKYWDIGGKIGTIQTISIQGIALSNHEGFVRLAYEFVGYETYADKKKAKADSVF